MVRVDTPNISIEKKSNEQNIQAAKSSLNEMADAINYLSAMMDNINARVSALESEE